MRHNVDDMYTQRYPTTLSRANATSFPSTDTAHFFCSWTWLIKPFPVTAEIMLSNTRISI